MRRRTFWSVAAAVPAVLITSLVSSAPASAATYGSVTGTYCGARGTFETYLGVPEINWIVDGNGRATSAHNGGCFGISPGHHIFWTPKSRPSWRVVPGNGIAVRVGITYLGQVCPPAPYSCLVDAGPTITVDTAAGNVYGQTYDNNGWGGHWYRV